MRRNAILTGTVTFVVLLWQTSVIFTPCFCRHAATDNCCESHDKPYPKPCCPDEQEPEHGQKSGCSTSYHCDHTPALLGIGSESYTPTQQFSLSVDLSNDDQLIEEIRVNDVTHFFDFFVFQIIEPSRHGRTLPLTC